MSILENPILLAVGSAIAGCIGTGLVGVFSGWWRDKTSLPIKVIEEQGRLKAVNAKQWEKLIMLRNVLENMGQKIPDREWSYKEVDVETRDPHPS